MVVDPARPPDSSRMGLWLAAAGGVVLALHLAYFGYFLGATCDDAFITLRYVQNLVAGEGLVFNPGERVEGFSNFLWLLVVSAFAGIGVDPLLASKALGLASLFVWIAILARMLRRAGWGSLETGGLVFLLGTSWPIAYYAVSGLETVFYGMLIAGAVAAVASAEGRITVTAGLWLLAVALARPEGVIFFPIFALVHLFRRREIRSFVPAACLFAIGYAAFLAWRFAYYGMLVPNTYLVKSPLREGLGGAWVRLVAGGMDEIVAFVSANGGPLFLLAAALGTAQARSAAVFAAAAAALAGGLFFVKFAGGDWMTGYRFLVPFVPLYLALAIEGLRQIGGRLSVPRRTAQVGLALAIAIVGVFNLSGTAEFHLQRGRYPWFVMTSEDMISAGRWIQERYPPSTRIVSWRIGALAYYSGLEVIDTWGLTDAHIARLHYQGRSSEAAVEEYLRGLAPRLVLTADRLAPGAEKTFAGRRYRVVEVFPQGTNSVWTLFEAAESG